MCVRACGVSMFTCFVRVCALGADDLERRD